MVSKHSNMNKIFFVLALLLICLSCQGQKNQKQQKIASMQAKPIVNRTDNLIGFACFEGGSESNMAALFSNLLTEKQYSTIVSKLYSNNAAEKYLATIVCERLHAKALIKLSKTELKQIKINKSGKDMVSICSGCTDWNELSIQELFKSDKNFLADATERWLKEMIK